MKPQCPPNDRVTLTGHETGSSCAIMEHDGLLDRSNQTTLDDNLVDHPTAPYEGQNPHEGLIPVKSSNAHPPMGKL